MNIGKSKYRCSLELGQQEVEGHLLIWAPYSGLTFTSQDGERGGSVGKVGDELMVEVTKT